MKINSVHIKNFYSYKDELIDLDKFNGLIFIEGKNRDSGGSNGSGKSALFEAIFWCLFGKTLRKSNEDSRVNVIAGRNCSVEVVIDDRIKIKRASRPTSLKVEIDGENVSGKHAQESQGIIESTLNTNFKVAAASMAFGQHNNFDFLGATPEDKRIIMRNFLNLEYIFKMRDKIRSTKSKYGESAKVSEALYKSKRDDYYKIEKTLEGIEKKKDSFKNRENYEKYSLEEILKSEKKVRDLKKQFAILLSEEDGREREAIEFKTKVEEGVHEKRTMCPECKSVVKISQGVEDIKHLCSALSFLEEEVQDIRDKKEKLDLKIKKITLPVSSKDLKRFLEFKDLASEEKTLSDQKKDIFEELEVLEQESVRSRKKYDVMRFWEKAFSEQGVIRYVIRNILDYFNIQCNIYLSALTNGQFFIEFDEELKEKISSHKVTVPYISLSGGEKAKINLAVLLALQSLLSLTSKEQFNLLLFDEVTENMDSEGIRGLANLLKIIKGKKVFIITHNKELKTYFDDSVRMTVIKTKGFSKVKI